LAQWASTGTIFPDSLRNDLFALQPQEQSRLLTRPKLKHRENDERRQDHRSENKPEFGKSALDAAWFSAGAESHSGMLFRGTSATSLQQIARQAAASPP
jgi:hypothetical protein